MNPRISILSLCLAVACLLSGCDALQLGVETSTPAARPTPAATASPAVPASATRATPTLPAATKVSADTATSAATVQPPASVTSANTPEALPTREPTSEKPTVVPGPPDHEVILILNPGPNSSVTSPVRVLGQSDPTFEQSLVVQISDASGLVIASQPAMMRGIGGPAVSQSPFEVLVPFTVTAQEPGRISVYSTSPRDGGLVHLSSVEVTLLAGGTASITQGLDHKDVHVILEPAPQASISGGSLHVSGFSDYVFERQLALALCGEGGSGAPDLVCGTVDNVLATSFATIHAPDVGQPGPFAGDLSYHVSARVHARLAVYSRSARDGGIVHLSSEPVQLAP